MPINGIVQCETVNQSNKVDEQKKNRRFARPTHTYWQCEAHTAEQSGVTLTHTRARKKRRLKQIWSARNIAFSIFACSISNHTARIRAGTNKLFRRGPSRLSGNNHLTLGLFANWWCPLNGAHKALCRTSERKAHWSYNLAFVANVFISARLEAAVCC